VPEVSESPGSLAVLGAPPRFREPLHVGKPSVGDRTAFLARVEAILDRGWFTNNGPEVIELEQRIAARLGVEHCVVVNNGTTALGILMRAANVKGEVLVPSFTFVATAHALTWEGIEPVFCDIDPETWTLDPDACEAAITPATGAILGVHLFGNACDTDRLSDLADKHGLPLFLDAAHAFGCSHHTRPLGGFGRGEAFSFHATKAFHTFEGGAITTNCEELATKARLLRNFGFSGYDAVVSLGTNAKMPEVCAAMGLANLDRFDEHVRGNRSVFETYARSLAEISGIRLRRPTPGESHNWHYVVIEVDRQALGLSRNQLQKALVAENVLARRYFFPGCHAMEPYASRNPGASDRLPHTIAAASRVLVLPGGQAITDDQAQTVCDLIRAAASRGDEIRAVLHDGGQEVVEEGVGP